MLGHYCRDVCHDTETQLSTKISLQSCDNDLFCCQVSDLDGFLRSYVEPPPNTVYGCLKGHCWTRCKGW